MKKVLFSAALFGITFLSAYRCVAQSKYRTGNAAKPATQQNTTTPPTTTPATQQQTAPKTTGNSRYVNANTKAGAAKANTDTTIKNKNNTTPPVTGSSRYRPGNNTATDTSKNATASGATTSTVSNLPPTILITSETVKGLVKRSFSLEKATTLSFLIALKIIEKKR